MAETTKIDLPVAGWFRFITAEWWENNSKFAVVRGSSEIDNQEFAVRLDLEKRAFLDHASNARIDELLQGKANEISKLVWEARRRQQGKGGGHAAA